ncbi:MAG TPA: biopolymer transporter ExbD [Opitutus sp.]|nr:biopolymer transporter ExbD [Opitutus sp.]
MLGRSYTQRHYEGAHIDMTPMVDCVLVLLIFLMVSSAFVQDPGIEVQKPDVGGTDVIGEQNALLIAISADDRIYFDGQEIHTDQVAALVKQAAVGRDPALIIRADRSATHGTFAAVYAEAKKAGIAHVTFATSRAETP